MNREPVWVVFITGAAGTGKSTVAELLGARWKTQHLDFDHVTRSLVDQALAEHPEWDEPTCLREVKAERYAEFFARVVSEVSTGSRPGVLVASAPMTGFLADSNAWAEVASGIRAAGAEPVVVWLNVNDATRRSRVAARGSVRDLGVDEGERVPIPPVVAHLAISAGASPEAVAEAISVELQKIFGKP